MDGQTGNSNSSKSQREIVVTTRWDYTEEPNPAFKRLMMLLLEPREKRRVNRDEKRNPQ